LLSFLLRQESIGPFLIHPKTSYIIYRCFKKEAAMKLNVRALALACGLWWGFGLFFLTWWIIALDGPTGEVTLIGRIYRGYSISPAGSVYGLVWGFFDGLIGGAILAWLYNFLAARFMGGKSG
jgi:hypothetical protein